MRQVATLVAIWRYPVKSLAGEPLDAADVSWHGVAGDRRWAFVRPDRETNGFPWLTIRHQTAMSRYSPRYVDEAKPNASRVVVQTPDGVDLDVADERLANQLGPGVRVMKQDRGVFDVMPLSLVSTATMRHLTAETAEVIDARRLRPNLVVDVGDHPYMEDEWVGHDLGCGSLRLRIDQRDTRCGMVNIDADTGVRNPAVLKYMAARRDMRIGVYGTTVAPGRVAVGNPVMLE